jgi:cytochrome c oxidase cbb3-type subunit IV
MLRDVIPALDYSRCAEIALGLFAASFAAILLTSLRVSRARSEQCASIPLHDHPVTGKRLAPATAETTLTATEPAHHG